MAAAKPSKLTYENFYNKCPKQKSRHYRNEPLVNIKLPFAGIFVGPTGSGKSNLVLQIIKHIEEFERIVLIAKELDQPLYKDVLIPRIRELEKKTGERVLLVSNTLADLPAIEDFDKKHNNLLVIDDMICESPKDLTPVVDFWIRGRHKNISRIFLSQSFYKTPSDIRKNSQIVCIKQLACVNDLKRVLAEYSLSITIEKALELYNDAVDSRSDGEPLNHWLTIDPTNPDPNLQFRKNWEGYKIK